MTDEKKVRFVAQQLLGSASAWWDTFNARKLVDHCFPLVLYSYWFAEQEAVRVSGAEARKHDYDGVCEQVQPSCIVC